MSTRQRLLALLDRTLNLNGRAASFSDDTALMGAVPELDSMGVVSLLTAFEDHGTGVRDYIHVQDLAEGHVAALDRLFAQPGSFTVNLGTGQGYSVLEVVAAYAQASGRPVPYAVQPRRAGDVAACYADPALAQTLLGWRARHDLARMCADSWRWQTMNPQGYTA